MIQLQVEVPIACFRQSWASEYPAIPRDQPNTARSGSHPHLELAIFPLKGLSELVLPS
jgi:hypothetical protein